MTIEHRMLRANGIDMHIAEAGNGPLVVLAHGFPESWYSWRAQILALASAGYHAVAPDMRGYGQTERPENADQYSIFHLVGDMVGLLDALQSPQAVIVGHDWGAPVAWHCALFRPDRFRAVAGLSVPYFPRSPTRPSAAYPESADAIFYQAYFCQPGRADAELARDPKHSVGVFQKFWSGDAADHSAAGVSMVPRNGGVLTGKTEFETLPPWLGEADVAFYAGEFARTGFSGALNWYRNIDRNWELTAPWAGAKIEVPALYMIGEHDLLMTFRGMDRLIPNLERTIPDLREKIVLPGCGHWTQRERADDVNAALLRFLAGLGD